MKRVLAVFAHPDDEVLAAAGTLALCVARGARATLVCATRGELGPIASAELATRETLAAVRERELRASCASLGVEDVRFLDLPDACVAWAAHERGAEGTLGAVIEHVRPQVILTFGPDGLYGHPDHVAVGELTARSRQAAARDRGVEVCRLFYSVMPGSSVAALLEGAARAGVQGGLWGLAAEHFVVDASRITASVDVTEVWDRKLAALRCHRTQLEADNVLAQLALQPAELRGRGGPVPDRGQTGDRPDAAAGLEIARRFLGVEHFRCADGLPGGPLDVLEELQPAAERRARG